MNTIRIARNLILVASCMSTSVASAELIARDDFEEGKLRSVWGPTARVVVTDELAKDGKYSLKYNFRGGADGTDSNAEARFDLGKEYPELSIRFDLHVPENYVHRSARPGNNKFVRLWTADYNDPEKVGASLMPQRSGESSIGSDYRKEASKKGMSTAVERSEDFITAADRGKWISVVIYAKAANDSAPGSLRIYKNGRLHLEDVLDINHVPGTQGYRYGYLLGWANSGYAEETKIHIDNVEFHDGEILSK